MKCKYKYQDKVEFKYNNINKVGYIEIIDQFGTFEQKEEPSYDIMSYKDACLYKHVRQSVITGVVEDDGLLRGNLYLENDVFKVGYHKKELTNVYTQIRIVGWLDWTSINEVSLLDWIGYKVEVK